MNKTLALVFLAASLALLIFGYDVYNSTASNLSLARTGAPPDRAVWLVIGGLLAGITGVFGLVTDEQKNP